MKSKNTPRIVVRIKRRLIKALGCQPDMIQPRECQQPLVSTTREFQKVCATARVPIYRLNDPKEDVMKLCERIVMGELIKEIVDSGMVLITAEKDIFQEEYMFSAITYVSAPLGMEETREET